MKYKTKTWQSIFQGGIVLKKILLETDVTVNKCAWNHIISLNENILYIGHKTMQTMRVYFV